MQPPAFKTSSFRLAIERSVFHLTDHSSELNLFHRPVGSLFIIRCNWPNPYNPNSNNLINKQAKSTIRGEHTPCGQPTP